MVLALLVSLFALLLGRRPIDTYAEDMDAALALFLQADHFA